MNDRQFVYVLMRSAHGDSAPLLNVPPRVFRSLEAAQEYPFLINRPVVMTGREWEKINNNHKHYFWVLSMKHFDYMIDRCEVKA